jgi:hypothetical protein
MKEHEKILLALLAKAEYQPHVVEGSGVYENYNSPIRRLVRSLSVVLPEPVKERSGARPVEKE